jgi:hypothetical protein
MMAEGDCSGCHSRRQCVLSIETSHTTLGQDSSRNNPNYSDRVVIHSKANYKGDRRENISGSTQHVNASYPCHVHVCTV